MKQLSIKILVGFENLPEQEKGTSELAVMVGDQDLYRTDENGITLQGTINAQYFSIDDFIELPLCSNSDFEKCLLVMEDMKAEHGNSVPHPFSPFADGRANHLSRTDIEEFSSFHSNEMLYSLYGENSEVDTYLEKHNLSPALFKSLFDKLTTAALFLTPHSGKYNLIILQEVHVDDDNDS